MQGATIPFVGVVFPTQSFCGQKDVVDGDPIQAVASTEELYGSHAYFCVEKSLLLILAQICDKTSFYKQIVIFAR